MARHACDRDKDMSVRLRPEYFKQPTCYFGLQLLFIENVIASMLVRRFLESDTVCNKLD